MLLCGLVAKQNLNQILKGVPKSLARWSDLGTLGSFLVPMYGGSLQVSAGGVFVEAKRYSFWSCRAYCWSGGRVGLESGSETVQFLKLPRAVSSVAGSIVGPGGRV